MPKISTGVLNTAILGIVLLVVLFQLYAQLVPEAQASGDSLNNISVSIIGFRNITVIISARSGKRARLGRRVGQNWIRRQSGSSMLRAGVREAPLSTRKQLSCQR